MKKKESVPGAGACHPCQDRDADKYDNNDHHVDEAYARNNKSPRKAANNKSKSDEIHYKGHVVSSRLDSASGSPLLTVISMELMFLL